jgi:adenosine deaminase
LHFLAESENDVIQSMVYGDDEPRDFHRFLRKFNILDHIRWNEDLIDRSIKAVCVDLDDDRVDYTWMRFTINKYMTHMRWHRHDAIRFVKDAFERYAPGRVGLILSLKYESERAGQKQLAGLIEHPIAECIDGLDLVGDEAYYDVDFYKSIFKRWKEADKILFAHVGESQDVENVRTAIIDLGVTEINHGIKIWEHDDIIQIAKDNGCCFHLALTSNLLTGVLGQYDGRMFSSRLNQHWHPVSRMFLSGVDITIGTDDPIQCNTTIDKEYDVLRFYLDIDNVDIDVEQAVSKIRMAAQDRVGIIPSPV